MEFPSGLPTRFGTRSSSRKAQAQKRKRTGRDPSGVRAEIKKWKQICPDAGRDGFIFPNSEGVPMDLSNLIDRVIPTGR